MNQFASTNPIKDPHQKCRKIDSNYYFDLKHITEYSHLEILDHPDYFTKLLSEF